MKTLLRSNILTTGLAMFSMFFGAGNVVFPLAIGQLTQDMSPFAIFGLLLSAVCVPFLGLIAMTLFDGDYKGFFNRLGVAPGFLLALCIMLIIGPFGAIPRCITLSFSTISMFLPQANLIIFSIISCLIIFAFTIRSSTILEVLGYVLTPFLLITLALIVIKGLLTPSAELVSGLPAGDAFFHGLKEGYQTMDLLGAFFFSTVVITCLKQEKTLSEGRHYRTIIKLALKASCIGAFLLAISYIGFCLVAAKLSPSLLDVRQDRLLGTIALEVLGPYAGIVASIAVALACLTTAIALSNVFAEFLHHEIFRGKVGYAPSLVVTLLITFVMSTLEFNGIVKFLGPILSVCYPALIVLSLVNICYKLYDFKPVKTPVLIAFVLTVVFMYI